MLRNLFQASILNFLEHAKKAEEKNQKIFLTEGSTWVGLFWRFYGK